jgi:hypothetical protein
MAENSLLWHYLEFSEICPAEHFFKIDPKGIEDDIK